MVLPLRLLFLSAHSLFSSLAQALIAVSIRDDNFQLEFYERKDNEWKLGCSSKSKLRGWDRQTAEFFFPSGSCVRPHSCVGYELEMAW